MRDTLDTLLEILEPFVVVPVAAVCGSVGLVLAIAATPIWGIALWVAYQRHLRDRRFLEAHPDLRGNGSSQAPAGRPAPASLARSLGERV
jgi:hypothetical protein